MDYARRTAVFRKILIISSRPSDPAVAATDAVRFRRFAAVLEEEGFSPLHAYVDSIGRLADLVERFGPDLVFSAPDHLPDTASPLPSSTSPTLNVHAWLEGKGIPYVGSSPETIELALSKTELKKKWASEGIATPAFLSFDSGDGISLVEGETLPPFPCIVKPADGGNSRGITKDSLVFDLGSLEAAVGRLGRNFRHILVERYLGLYPDFREITCACVGNGEARLLMPAEILFREPTEIRIVTTKDKDSNATKAVNIDDERLREAAKAFAGRALASAGVRDYSRCDMIFADGGFWAIEVNGQPMVPDPWFGACASHAGLGERDYILAILRAAVRRLREEAS